MDTKVARHYIFYTLCTDATYSGYTVIALPVHCQDRFLNIASGGSGKHIFGNLASPFPFLYRTDF